MVSTALEKQRVSNALADSSLQLPRFPPRGRGGLGWGKLASLDCKGAGLVPAPLHRTPPSNANFGIPIP